MERRALSRALTVSALALITLGAFLQPARDPCTMAIALRDHVPTDQKLVSKLYTLPFLAVAYDEHAYFEADAWDSKRRDVQRALADAASKGCVVDLFFLSHGNDYASWIAAGDAGAKLRLVYDTGAGDAAQGERWNALGARVFVGHPGINVAPAFFTFFLPVWLGGARAEDATLRANWLTENVLDAARAAGLADDHDVDELWRGTEARLFGDPAAAYP